MARILSQWLALGKQLAMCAVLRVGMDWAQKSRVFQNQTCCGLTIMSNSEPPGLLEKYLVDGFFDEMFAGERAVHGHYSKLHASFAGLNADEFNAKKRSVDLAFLR